MKVRVYWNFNRKEFSIQKKYDGTWYVIDHASLVLLRDATFKVSEAGRQRVLREGRKNVHAYVIGELVVASRETLPLMLDGGYTVRYNPYRDEHFTGDDGVSIVHHVSSAEIVSLFVSDHKTPTISAVGLGRKDPA